MTATDTKTGLEGLSNAELCAKLKETGRGPSWAGQYFSAGDGLLMSEAARRLTDTAAPAVPEGMVLVPREPTEAMHNAARDWSDRKYGKPIGIDASDGCYRAMLAAAPAAPAPPAPAAGVQVKVLEWSEDWPLSAQTLAGCYFVQGGYPDGQYRLVFSHSLKEWEGNEIGRYLSKEAAKAAAQADFEHRILPALEASPPPAAGGAEPVGWASQRDLDRLKSIASGATNVMVANEELGGFDIPLYTHPPRDAEIERLRAALEPFARFGAAHDGPDGIGKLAPGGPQDDDYVWMRPSPGYPRVKTSDFRRAVAALATKEGSTDA